jgi:hypothetical protein
MIGLSLSYCVRDILDGLYTIAEVDKIITGTCAFDAASWERLLVRYSERHWQKDTKQAREICMKLLLQGKIDQPRTRNEHPPCIGSGHWVEALGDIYDWQIHNMSGEVQANNLKDAMKKVLDVYFDAVPFPPSGFTTLGISCKKRIRN